MRVLDVFQQPFYIFISFMCAVQPTGIKGCTLSLCKQDSLETQSCEQTINSSAENKVVNMCKVIC